jgi:hypothetical protein
MKKLKEKRKKEDGKKKKGDDRKTKEEEDSRKKNEGNYNHLWLKCERRPLPRDRRINMKLFITRDQARGLLGGVKFQLKARVELTDEEAQLVKKYKVERETLLKKKIEVLGIPLTTIDLMIDSLTAGQTFKCNNIAEILVYEENVKEACKAFKSHLEVMRSFGGEEVIEYL